MNSLCLCVIPEGIFFEMSALLILVWSQMKNNTEKGHVSESGNFRWKGTKHGYSNWPIWLLLPQKYWLPIWLRLTYCCPCGLWDLAPWSRSSSTLWEMLSESAAFLPLCSSVVGLLFAATYDKYGSSVVHKLVWFNLHFCNKERHLHWPFVLLLLDVADSSRWDLVCDFVAPCSGRQSRLSHPSALFSQAPHQVAPLKHEI